MQERYSRPRLKTRPRRPSSGLFFQTFFRAKFADTESDYEKFEGDYHYEMYRNQKVRDYFGGFSDKDLLFSTHLRRHLVFRGSVSGVAHDYEHESLIFNKLLDQTSAVFTYHLGD